MSHSMSTQHKKWREGYDYCFGPDITKFHIRYLLLYAMSLRCVCARKVGDIVTHRCSVYLHKWHAQYWEVASYALISLPLIHSRIPSSLGVGVRVGPRIGHHVSFLPYSVDLEAGHVLCLLHTLTHVSLQVTTMPSTHPHGHPCFHFPGGTDSVGFLCVLWPLDWVHSILLL